MGHGQGEEVAEAEKEGSLQAKPVSLDIKPKTQANGFT